MSKDNKKESIEDKTGDHPFNVINLYTILPDMMMYDEVDITNYMLENPRLFRKEKLDKDG